MITKQITESTKRKLSDKKITTDGQIVTALTMGIIHQILTNDEIAELKKHYKVTFTADVPQRKA